MIHSSGTVLSAELSLGYDVPRTRIEELLLEGARAAGLEEPFVQIRNLGDFSVTYRIAGLFKDVKQILSARSRLRAKVLDALHEGGIEIVSPTFMNTRAHSPEARFIPPSAPAPAPVTESTAEALAFDKADRAETLEEMKKRHDALRERVKETEALLEGAGEGPESRRLSLEKERLAAECEALARALTEADCRDETNGQ